MTTGVKICGLRRLADVRAVNAVQANYAGFVFFEKSKRNISLEEAKALMEQLDASVCPVAVCVSPTKSFLSELERVGFGIIQIHGDISPALLEDVKTPIWQAINISGGMQACGVLHHSAIKGYVIDGAQYGAGKTFGWEEQEQYARQMARELKDAIGEKLFVLAGGLKEENVALAIRLFAPDVVDVSSGVESKDFKDADKIHGFVKKVRTLA